MITDTLVRNHPEVIILPPSEEDIALEKVMKSIAYMLNAKHYAVHDSRVYDVSPHHLYLSIERITFTPDLGKKITEIHSGLNKVVRSGLTVKAIYEPNFYNGDYRLLGFRRYLSGFSWDYASWKGGYWIGDPSKVFWW